MNATLFAPCAHLSPAWTGGVGVRALVMADWRIMTDKRELVGPRAAGGSRRT